MKAKLIGGEIMDYIYLSDFRVEETKKKIENKEIVLDDSHVDPESDRIWILNRSLEEYNSKKLLEKANKEKSMKVGA